MFILLHRGGACMHCWRAKSLVVLRADPSSILILGRPGIGKTTVIRDISCTLADDMHRRVVIVDTSNEIGGDGDVPHPAVGSARRMQVP